MGQNLKTATWIIAGQKIDVTEFPESKSRFIFEHIDCDGRWFVCHQENDGKFYLQENLKEDGEIVEIGVYDSMVLALSNLAWCGKVDFGCSKAELKED